MSNIVNKIVAEHKGKIWVESEIGKGTSYIVTLPQD
jgi:signal transduction histidine kinase